jgi:glycosyltransferase involved in cell wall biosynthesis
VLEAMAMGRPVVASDACAQGIDADAHRELLTAANATDYAEQIARLLHDPGLADAVGRAARERVLRSYSWEAHLSAFDRRLAAISGVALSA